MKLVKFLVVALCMLSVNCMAQGVSGYFGPFAGYVADPALQGGVTHYYASVTWPTVGGNQSSLACPAIMNFVGGPSQPAWIELPQSLVIAATPGTQSITCYPLVNVGDCFIMDGHILAYPDLFGMTLVADHLVRCGSPVLGGPPKNKH